MGLDKLELRPAQNMGKSVKIFSIYNLFRIFAPQTEQHIPYISLLLGVLVHQGQAEIIPFEPANVIVERKI